MQHRQAIDGAKYAALIGAATLAADNTPVTVDIRDFQCVEIDLSIGVGGITFSGANKIEFVLTAADYDPVSGAVGAFSNVVTGEVYIDGVAVTVTNGIIKSLVAAHATATPYRVEYIGQKGALQLLADFSGTHGTGTPISAICRRSRGRSAPAA